MLVQLNKFDKQLLLEEPVSLETTDGDSFEFSPMTQHMNGLYERYLQGVTPEDSNVEAYEAPLAAAPEAGSSGFKSRFG